MRTDDNDERSEELEDSELDSVAGGGYQAGDEPPPEEDGSEPGTPPSDDSDQPTEGEEMFNPDGTPRDS